MERAVYILGPVAALALCFGGAAPHAAPTHPQVSPDTVDDAVAPGGDDHERLLLPAIARPQLAAGVAPTLRATTFFAPLRPASVLAQATPPPLADVEPAASAEAGEGDAEAAAVSPLLMLLFSFLGGLILNLMPCVLPVLSIKVLGLVQQADSSRREILWHGVAYTMGVLASFLALAIMLIVLQHSGRLVGWGFQLQSPAFVAVLGALVFGFGLSLFGIFEVALPGMNAANNAAAKQHGVSGSFTSGVFATLLATPCTAPMLAPALGFALVQPPLVLTGYLLTVGLGLAFPFLVLAMVPAWAKLMPRPGAWMETFKHAMGFLLMGTTVWILDILAAQVSADSLIGYVAFLCVLAVSAWIYGHWGAIHRPTGVRFTALGVAILLGVLGGAQLLTLERPAKADAGAAVVATAGGGHGEHIRWVDFAGSDVESMARGGQTVFIDFTADWCVTCKVYERTVIETDAIRDVFRHKCIVPVKADYTSEDEKITQWLRRFKRPGVPMYVILPAGKPDSPILLPDVLTKSSLLDGLDRAGPTDTKACPS